MTPELPRCPRPSPRGQSRTGSKVSKSHPDSPGQNGAAYSNPTCFSFRGPSFPRLSKPWGPAGSAPHQPHLVGLLGNQQHINSSCHQASRSPGSPSKASTMRLQELLPSYQLHPGDGQASLDHRSPDPRPSCPGLLTLLPSPPVLVASSSRVGPGAVAPSWGSLPARSPSLNLFCSGASSSLLCQPSLPPRCLPASSGLLGGLAMAPDGGSRCLLLGTRKEAGASRSKRPRGGSGAPALRLRVRAG